MKLKKIAWNSKWSQLLFFLYCNIICDIRVYIHSYKNLETQKSYKDKPES